MNGLEQIQTLLVQLPAGALLAFFLVSAALEYVVPPYWGDLVLLLAFFWAVQGHGSAPLVFAACVAGSTVGAAAAYGLGRRFGLSLARRILGFGLVSRRRAVGRRADSLLRRYGPPVLASNRFLPVVRGVMLYGAGALRLPFGSCMAFTLASNVAWAVLLWAVAHLSRGVTWTELVDTFRHSSRLGAVAALLLATTVVLLAIWRDRRPLEDDVQA